MPAWFTLNMCVQFQRQQYQHTTNSQGNVIERLMWGRNQTTRIVCIFPRRPKSISVIWMTTTHSCYCMLNTKLALVHLNSPQWVKPHLQQIYLHSIFLTSFYPKPFSINGYVNVVSELIYVIKEWIEGSKCFNLLSLQVFQYFISWLIKLSVALLLGTPVFKN